MINKGLLLAILFLSVISCVDMETKTQKESSDESIIETTSLIEYAIEGNIDGVKSIVENGGDIDIGDGEGNSVLMIASSLGHIEIVEYLANAGLDINAVNEWSQTAVMGAAGGGHLEVVKYLADNGADINHEDNFQFSALKLASENGHLEVVKYLVINGVNINSQSDFGYTALMMASEDGHLEVVKYLVEAGAYITPKAENVSTALDLATENGHTEIAEYLESVEITPAELSAGDVLANKDAFIKANDFYGYKGDIKITVDWYEEDYAAEGGSSNIGVVYNAYIDFVSPENQKVIFYESEHAQELEINIVNNGSPTFNETNTTAMVFYEKKKIYESAMSSEEKNELTQNVPLYKYPYNFWGYIYYGGEPTSLQDLISPEKSAQRYLTCAGTEGYDPFDDYSVKITTDEEQRITAEYMGDNGDSFTWKNGVVHKKFIGIMGEGITIEFLNDKGWFRRSE